MADPSLVDLLWIVVASGLVFVMQGGFAFLESGLTRSKNSINVAVKNLTDLGVSILAFWLFGFAIMFGATRAGLFGTSGFFLRSDGVAWTAAFFLFQSMFCSTSATIVSGAVAERMHFSSYIVSTIILSALVYPVYGHWAWGGFFLGRTQGWLEARGFIDFAGSTVVHSVGGWIALAALLIIGPRAGRFGDDGSARQVPASNVPAAVLGAILLWFGWFGFNGGSTLAMNASVAGIIVNTALAAAAGMVATLAVGWPLLGKPDVGLLINGSLAGLVAITAPCAYVNEAQAIVIGVVGGVAMLGGQVLLERLRIDDAVGAIPVHLVAGIWGTLSVGIFGDLQLLGTGLSRGEQLQVQALGILGAGAWAFGISLVLLWITNRISPLRVTAQDEEAGLNVAEHGASTEIYDLFRVMAQQEASGDLTLRVPVEPFTEVGQIARRYNQVLASLQDNLVEKSDYLEILDNVSDGIFLIDRSGTIGPYYSRATGTMLRAEQLAGAEFLGVIGPMLPDKTVGAAREFLELLFSDTVDRRTVMKLNPLKSVELFVDDRKGSIESLHARFSFTPVERHAGVRQIMIIVQDATEETLLNRQMEEQRLRNQTELELLQGVLHVDPELIDEYVHSSRARLRQIGAIFEEDRMPLVQRLHGIARHVHAIKGDTSALELDFVAERARSFETRVRALRDAPTVANDDFISLAIQFSALSDAIERIESLGQRIGRFRDTFSRHNASGVDIVRLTLTQLAERVSRDTGKRVVLNLDRLDLSSIADDHRRVLRDALIQLVRNAVFHGVESPDERRTRGKRDVGLVEITSELVDDMVAVTVRDDGRGIDLQRIKARALARGVINEQDAATLEPSQIARLLFAHGVSTAPEGSEHAGEGVGMDLVRRTMSGIGGRLRMTTRPGRYCEFQLLVPRLE